MKTIVMIDGGAGAAGKNDLAQGGWAARLHRDSLAVNLESPEEVEVLNFARTDRNLTNMLLGRKMTYEPPYEDRLKGLRMASEMGSRIISIIGVGQNEAAERSPIKFRRDIGRLCSIAAAQSTLLILVGPNLIDPERINLLGAEARYDNTTIAGCSEIMANTAAEHRVSYIDTVALLDPFKLKAETLSEDGRNPNTIGHAALHGVIKDELALLNVRL